MKQFTDQGVEVWLRFVSDRPLFRGIPDTDLDEIYTGTRNELVSIRWDLPWWSCGFPGRMGNRGRGLSTDRSCRQGELFRLFPQIHPQ